MAMNTPIIYPSLQAEKRLFRYGVDYLSSKEAADWLDRNIGGCPIETTPAPAPTPYWKWMQDMREYSNFLVSQALGPIQYQASPNVPGLLTMESMASGLNSRVLGPIASAGTAMGWGYAPYAPGQAESTFPSHKSQFLGPIPSAVPSQGYNSAPSAPAPGMASGFSIPSQKPQVPRPTPSAAPGREGHGSSSGNSSRKRRLDNSGSPHSIGDIHYSTKFYVEECEKRNPTGHRNHRRHGAEPRRSESARKRRKQNRDAKFGLPAADRWTPSERKVDEGGRLSSVAAERVSYDAEKAVGSGPDTLRDTATASINARNASNLRPNI